MTEIEKGMTVSGYELLEVLGTGGMAQVWLAKNGLKKKAAVKILLRKYCENEIIRERFEREANVMLTLENRYIRQVYDYNQIDDRPYIIMEYLEGTDLRSMLDQEREFTRDELVRWWNQMVEALNYTHSKGVVHRDIKPSNIFIDRDGNAKLLDFGVAKIRGNNIPEITTHGTRLGTLLYSSPEQMENSKKVDYHTDIYSLALTFVKLFTRKDPFDIDSDNDLAAEVMLYNEKVRSNYNLDGVPDEWRRFLEPYLAKEPSKRPKLVPFETATERGKSDGSEPMGKGGASERGKLDSDETVAEPTIRDGGTKLAPKFCRKCGTAMSPHSNFCKKCGAKLF